jgi:hypothetical protein
MNTVSIFFWEDGVVRKKTFFMIGHRLYDAKNKTAITIKEVQVARARRESKEYKQLRRKFNEDRFDIINVFDKWIIKEKE